MSQNTESNSKKRLHESNLEFFRTRLIARLCIALTCFIQFIPRFATIFGDNITSQSQKIALYSIPFAPAISLIVVIEYILFKKKGPGIVKYPKIVDLIILILFIADWIAVLISSVVRIQQTNPPSFQISTLYGFVSFAWRSLLVTLIVQKWQLKIIAPVIALIVATVYAIHYDPKTFYFYLLRASTQLFNIVVIIYCEDKLKWRMMWSNLEQVKWVQVNNFILNNIPENIMILDFKGEAKFISDYCRNFMKKCHLSLDTKDFFGKIQDLKEQQSEAPEPPSPPDTGQMERLSTANAVLIETNPEDNVKVDILSELIENFRTIIKEKNLQERQFLAYNGKLKMDDNPQEQDKCIEVKISFVQHFNNEYIILILRDTTQRDLLVTLQETNKYKDQLLASVSHELRAPLNGNINLVEAAVNSPKIPEEIKESLLVPALRSSQFLLHIINDILDMCQIKEKKLRLCFQSGNLQETIRSTAQLVELQAKMKGIELAIELDPNLPQTFCTDHLRLSQIVLNLLSNAIKFTQEGAVKLQATPLHDETSSFHCVKISVEDSGIGMSQENLDKLFTSYTHIEFEKRPEINPTGVGLGLNIASNLAQLLGPKSHQNITVTSTPNQGSIFSFIIEDKEKSPLDLDEMIDLNKSSGTSWEVANELPIDLQPTLFSKFQTSVSSQYLETQKPKIKGLCSCPKILIVDDNPFNTMAFETILSSLEIKCDSVYSGSSAIKKVLNCENKRCGKDCRLYSVIFMDQEMPEMNGSETVKEIRRLQKEDLAPRNMRIIGCTAHKSKEEVERFMKAGLDECIHKPISISMIKNIL